MNLAICDAIYLATLCIRFRPDLDELGLKAYSPDGEGRLLTHVIFHPVQKSLNRLIQIDYTVRVQSLSGFNE